MFKFSSTEEDKGVIQKLLDSTIEKVKTFFTQMFDFIPSFEEIKGVLQAMLPSWMQPEATEAARRRLEAEIAMHQEKIASGDDRYGFANIYSREEAIADLQEQIASLPNSYAKGSDGFKNFGSGTLAMLHGNEAVVPLDTPKGQIYAAINDLLNNQGQMSTGGGNGGTAVVVGGTSNSNNQANVSNSNYTISSGFTSDDMVRMEFVNRAY